MAKDDYDVVVFERFDGGPNKMTLAEAKGLPIRWDVFACSIKTSRNNAWLNIWYLVHCIYHKWTGEKEE